HVNHCLVIVYQCLRFVLFGLRSILVLCKQAEMGEGEVLVNDYTWYASCMVDRRLGVFLWMILAII
ncbi:MAG: hypothetical protein U9N34_09885, partial [Candidatus Cloacimonadota bacterium]|nr:hypothetical protein [Candidatus Cloacimonadota bacterium]